MICPFHHDRKPSLRINAESGGYKCMACGEHGELMRSHFIANGMSSVSLPPKSLERGKRVLPVLAISSRNDAVGGPAFGWEAAQRVAN